MAGFVTADLQLASYLVTRGHQLERIEGVQGRRRFVFPVDAEADSFTYFRDTHLVSARRLFDSYRHLKSLLFETAGRH